MLRGSAEEGSPLTDLLYGPQSQPPQEPLGHERDEAGFPLFAGGFSSSAGSSHQNRVKDIN
jgi:hypothetical protein